MSDALFPGSSIPIDAHPIYRLVWRGPRNRFDVYARLVDNLGGYAVAVVSHRGIMGRFGLEFHADRAAVGRIREVFAGVAFITLAITDD
jgi:hypothetical protein